MTFAQLPNYIRSNRKRLGLSQGEVAFLLGNKGATKVSRYEMFAHEPSLKMALAFEIIFQRSASELFGGLYQEVEKEVTERAKILAEKLNREPPKREILANIANKFLN